MVPVLLRNNKDIKEKRLNYDIIFMYLRRIL